MEPVPETRQALVDLAEQGEDDLEPTLRAMSAVAQEIAPACVGLSLAQLADGLTFTMVASNDEAAVLDAVQYLDGGPCVEAGHEAHLVDVSGTDLMNEGRWLLYAHTTAATGVASSLTLPILQQGRVIGSVNLYGATPDAFDGRHEQLARALGASAEAAVSNADLSFRTRLAAAYAPQRVADRDDVDIAVGMIAARQRVDIPIAEERLRQAAARAGLTEGQVARVIRALTLPES